MVKVTELEDGDLERIDEAKAMLKSGKTEADISEHFTKHGFIPYHIQFIIDIAAGRIPLEMETDEKVKALLQREKKQKKQQMVIGLIVAGVVLAIIAGVIYFQLLGG